jgi:hypothetical protein
MLKRQALPEAAPRLAVIKLMICPEPLFEQSIQLLGIGLALALLHPPTDEISEQLLLALPVVFNLGRILAQDLRDQALDSAGIGKLL